MPSEWPRGLFSFVDTVYAMEPNKGEKSGEMYSPDDQGEYMPEAGVPSFSIQGLSDTLTALDTKVTMVQPPSEEYALLLEVTMADCPGCLCLPAFLWNLGMVMHVLKGDPTLRDPSMYNWTALAQLTCSSSTSRATKDSFWRPLKPSGPMWERCSLSGSPTLCTSLSFSFHWWKGGAGQLPCQNSATRGLEWSIKVTPR